MDYDGIWPWSGEVIISQVYNKQQGNKGNKSQFTHNSMLQHPSIYVKARICDLPSLKLT